MIRRLLGAVAAFVLAGCSAAVANDHEASRVTTEESALSPSRGEQTLTYLDEKGGSKRLLVVAPQGAPRGMMLFTNATIQDYDNAVARSIISSFADKGFLAVSVEYNNTTDIVSPSEQCAGLERRAHSIYGVDLPQSAVATLRAAYSLAPSVPIVVAGFSQGAMVASLAGDYATNVRGGWLIGVWPKFYDPTYIEFPCALPVNRNLKNIRAINGVHDEFGGGAPNKTAPAVQEARNRENVKLMTDACAGSKANVCTLANGSGWYLVQDADVLGGKAIHAYPYAIKVPYVTKGDLVDPFWNTGAAPWTRAFNVEWLSRQVP